MDARHPLTPQHLACFHGQGMAGPHPREGDRLEDDVVGGEEDIRKPATLQGLEDLERAVVVGVVFGEQGEEEARVDEDHL
jgi:hypothetical protein